MSGPSAKLDPFKPTAPAIPGVPERAPEEKKKDAATPAASAATTAKGPFAQFSWQAISQSPQMMFGAGISIVVLIGVAALAWSILEPAPLPAPVVIEQAAPAGKGDTTATSATPAPQLPDA